MGRRYAEGRNTDHGPGQLKTVSALSPWVRCRLLHERELIEAALLHGDGAAKFVSEVLWRSYFKGWLEQRPEIWTRYCKDRDDAAALLARNGGLSRDYAAATNGSTGIDCFDAWAGELTSHGWLHNHARMWFASIWIFTLRLPWQLGADFFLRHLIDGDAASNTLSWRWVAGLHTPGKHYLARADNIQRHTDGRFDAHGLNETAACLPMDEPVARLPITPAGALPDTDYRLVLHGDDLDWTALSLSRPPVAVIGWSPTESRADGMAVSADVSAFADGALKDAIARAAAQFGCTAQIHQGALADIADGPPLVMPWLPVGRLRDNAGTPAAVQLRGAYDDALWPLASAGFFKLKTAAGGALQPVGLDLPAL